MADHYSKLQLENYLKKIKKTIAAEVPTYLKAMSGNSTNNRYKYHKPAYKVLNCSVKLLDQFKLAFHAASVMYEAEINLEDNESENVHFLLVKTMPTDAMIRSLMNSADQFFNESKVYSEMVPLLLQTCSAPSGGEMKAERPSSNLTAAYDLFPKCYYVSPDPENGMIVLQDLRNLGYKIGGDEMMLMDYKHVVVALEGLARFHALSYAMKKKDLRRYEQHIVTQIRDARRFMEKQTALDSMNAGYPNFLRYTAMLVLAKFDEKQQKEGGLYTEKIGRVLERIDNCSELLRELLSPDESLAVLCHGDFNRNNMLFRYDSNNRPSGVKFFDFQNPYYASPAIDLSFFLFVNAGPELWASCWDDMFSVYHRTLLDSLSEFLNCPQEALLPEFSLEAFKQQFSKYALYGFLIAASFIIGQSDEPDRVKAFDLFSDGLPSMEEADSYMKENVTLVKDEVIDRVLPLTQELLNKIIL
jgi:hypothetical protein